MSVPLLGRKLVPIIKTMLIPNKYDPNRPLKTTRLNHNSQT